MKKVGQQLLAASLVLVGGHRLGTAGRSSTYKLYIAKVFPAYLVSLCWTW
ncbi:hypothetical protein [Lactiplantibacillus mudanjiangensis]|uniref:Uncharacterized protein n=1 Tax=Lactiplantibacillus mudanjiangensis TaxID=1296538 RepID=A0A660DXB4_9LACO|nr:hypothetical protein [Lactiplantibacillus mudanjiangensis]VDG23640.1 hypothetical protein MUDAN_IGPPGNFN_02177 [Lactiplantibacillus mudanjiangensis]VDG27782.1 hypothetical protein MUDAN_MDHGFNIF_02606 [Lactiplantibacillus mudanjiangensis]